MRWIHLQFMASLLMTTPTTVGAVEWDYLKGLARIVVGADFCGYSIDQERLQVILKGLRLSPSDLNDFETTTSIARRDFDDTPAGVQKRSACLAAKIAGEEIGLVRP